MKITTFNAAGRVAIGFSFPWVAKYAASAGTVTYSDAMRLARGVSVQVEPTTNDDNNFYADNQLAESEAGIFSGGTFTLTVDGLLFAAEKFIMGLPEKNTDGWALVGDEQEIPNVGIAYIAKYMCDGQISFRPEILLKAKFNQIGGDYQTQEEEIDWHTQELSGTLMRADDENHHWKALGDDWSTEAEAETQLKTYFGVTGA